MADVNPGRIAVDVDVVISCSRFGLMRGKAVSLGLDGMSIRTDARILSLCTKVTVTFRVGGIGSGHIEAAGEVHSQSDMAVDVRFDKLAGRVRAQLSEFIRSRSGGPGEETLPEVNFA